MMGVAGGSHAYQGGTRNAWVMRGRTFRLYQLLVVTVGSLTRTLDLTPLPRPHPTLALTLVLSQVHGLGMVAPSFNISAGNAHLSIAGDYLKGGACKTPLERAALSGMHAAFTTANSLLE